MELPAYVDRRLARRISLAAWYRKIPDNPHDPQAPGGSLDALYVTADQPHPIIAHPRSRYRYGLLVQQKTDAVYVTRFQKERWTDKDRAYPKIDAKFLGEAKYSDASVMHPLPRVNELDALIRHRPARVYFQQGGLRRTDPHGADLAAFASA